MTTSNEHNNAPAVPQGWAIKFEGNDISVSNDHMGCIVPHTETVDRKMPSEVLHALCRDLLAATPAPAPAQEVGLPKGVEDELGQLSLIVKGLRIGGVPLVAEQIEAIIAALRAKGQS